MPKYRAKISRIETNIAIYTVECEAVNEDAARIYLENAFFWNLDATIESEEVIDAEGQIVISIRKLPHA